MHQFSDEHVLEFLVQLFLLLVTAKCLGELCRRWGYPALVGEIFTGLLLGPTIFRRVWPTAHAFVFPPGASHQGMLETVSWLGVLFMLLTVGFEVNIARVWRQGKACLKIGIVGVLVPVIAGCAVFWWLPESVRGPEGTRLSCTLLLAAAAAISAIPVIAKLLHDMEILKSDFGLITLSAFMVNDVLGWMIFAVVLAVATQTKAEVQAAVFVLGAIIVFAGVCLSVGSTIVGRVIRKFKQSSLPHPATTLTFIFCLGILCGSVTQQIGVHAILGFFLAGVMVGNTPEITDRTREIISQMVHAIFVPVFFASIGINIDFWKDFDLLLVGIFTAVALGGKFIGAAAGALWGRIPRAEALSTGIAHIPGGAMEIVVGVLALEMQIISQSAFVAVVFAAVSSSLLVGPLLAWSLRRHAGLAVHNLLLRAAFKMNLVGDTPMQVIEELCARAADVVNSVDKDTVIAAARAREESMGTALDYGLAIPHARVAGLARPIVTFGYSPSGIDWDARDGLPTHFVFLILVPEENHGVQVQILSALAKVVLQPGIRKRLARAQDARDAHHTLTAELRKQALSSNET